jgi:Ca2+-binding RTX toxin-like protein
LKGGSGNDALYGDGNLVTIKVKASAFLWDSVAKPSVNGAPKFALFADGLQVGEAVAVNADERNGETQDFTFITTSLTHFDTLEVRYINDTAGVFPGDTKPVAPLTADRNLFVKEVAVTNDAFGPTNAIHYRVDDTRYLAAGNPQFRTPRANGLMAWDGGLVFDVKTAGLFQAIGNDTLKGGCGDDILNGGKDTGLFLLVQNDSRKKCYQPQLTVKSVEAGDVLTGGHGKDTFVYIKGDGADTITDFQDNVDILRLANVGAFNLVDVLNGTFVDFGVAGEGIYVKSITAAELADDIVLAAVA